MRPRSVASAGFSPSPWAGLFCGGLVAWLVWCVLVRAQLPSWFDPGEDCDRRFGTGGGAAARARTTEFPPQATCEFRDGDAFATFDYLSPARSTMLTVVGVVLGLWVLSALAVLTWKALRGEQDGAGVPASDRRPGSHLLAVAVAGAVCAFIGVGVGMVLLMLGGPLAAGAVVLAFGVGIATLMSRLDRADGPGRNGAAGSRRRGAFVGLAGIVGMIVAVLLLAEFNGPGGEVDSPALPIGYGVLCALVVGAQWLIARRRADGNVVGGQGERDGR